LNLCKFGWRVIEVMGEEEGRKLLDGILDHVFDNHLWMEREKRERRAKRTEERRLRVERKERLKEERREKKEKREKVREEKREKRERRRRREEGKSGGKSGGMGRVKEEIGEELEGRKEEARGTGDNENGNVKRSNGHAGADELNVAGVRSQAESKLPETETDSSESHGMELLKGNWCAGRKFHVLCDLDNTFWHLGKGEEEI
jgi:hypothetical protein